MTSEAKQISRAAKDLHRLQDEQAQSVQQVSRLRGKLQKASSKMQCIEADMAKLEQHVYELRHPGGQPMAQYATGLRPARLIINPKSGSFEKQVGSPDNLVALLRAHGIQAEVFVKTSTRAVRAWMQEAVANDEALVIAAGGDGTIEDVAFPLIGTRTTLGIIPVGTMNNLARVLGIPLDVEQACALLGAGITRQIDVGSIRGMDKPKGTYFMETAGLGLAVALPAGQNVKKGRWGKLPQAFREIFNSSTSPIVVELDSGETLETRVKLVTVSNAPLFGINNLIAPDAKMDDGMFDLALYDGMSDVELAKYFLSNANGQRVSNPNVRFYRTRRVHIRSHEAATADKDALAAQLDLDIEVIPSAISVIVGRGFGLSWPVDAVQSVPPLTGTQAAPKDEQAAEPAKPANGVDHAIAEAPPQQPGTQMTGAR